MTGMTDYTVTNYQQFANRTDFLQSSAELNQRKVALQQGLAANPNNKNLAHQLANVEKLIKQHFLFPQCSGICERPIWDRVFARPPGRTSIQTRESNRRGRRS